MLDKNIKNKDLIINEIVHMRVVRSLATKTIIDILVKRYNVSERTAYNYLNWAKDKIKEIYLVKNETALEEAVARLEEQMEALKASGDRKLYLQYAAELHKLVGLHRERLDITSGGEGIIIKIVKPDNE